MKELKIYALSVDELKLLRDAMTGTILSDQELKTVRAESFGRHVEKESDEFIRVDYFKVRAVRSHLEEEIRLGGLAEEGDVTAEMSRFAAYLGIMRDHLATSLDRDYSEYMQRLSARKARSKNAKQLDPIYQKTADYIRRSEPGAPFLSRRKIAERVNSLLTNRVIKGSLKLKKVAPEETIRKHIK